MPIRGSPNGAAHSCPRSPQPGPGLVDVIARNRWTPSLGLAVDVINRYGWTSSIGSSCRHHSVRPSMQPIPCVGPMPLLSTGARGTYALCNFESTVRYQRVDDALEIAERIEV